DAVVLRDGAFVELELAVDDSGRVGFTPGGAFGTNYLSATPEPSIRSEGDTEDRRPIDPGVVGAKLVAVDGLPVSSLIDARGAMIGASTPGEATTFALTLQTDAGETTLDTELSGDDVTRLHALGWTADDLLRAFAPATVLQVGDGPGHSLALGLRETQRMLTRVYLTLGRLADGSVKPEQLKGPVGITHIGSRVAREGWVRLLFFIGLISANLAVLNFLPLPIVDGGLFLLLCYEGVRGKPAPVAVQNALTLVGLVLIAAVFIFVTTNDVLNLFG
ncbi:MAG: site-2 protease family protein, partial [Planctomycetota bacterium]